MRSRVFSLLLVAPLLIGSLASQTEPSAAPGKASQNSPAEASEPTQQQTPTPARPPATASTASTPPSATTTGQNPAKSDSDDSITTIVSAVNEVRVVFTVTDRHGHYIKDLKQSEFRVIDDRKPAEMRSFRSETDLPLQVGLLVDASNSVRDRFKFEQEAAIEFLNGTIRRGYDEAFVVGFDVTPEVVQDFTDNSENLSIGV